jgi:phosphoglycolate phosphatase
MIKELSRLTGIDAEDLKAAFKRVHEKHTTTEYAFAIEELDVLHAKHGKLTVKQTLERYGPAIEAFRRTRQRTMRLYDGVSESLAELRNRGKTLVAMTDTFDYYAIRRLKDLGVEEYFSAICAPRDPGLPPGVSPREARRYTDPSRYETIIPHRISPEAGKRKPDPSILGNLLTTMAVPAQETILVGDSLSRDIRMGQSCGAWDVYAKYGDNVNPEYYQELLKITYWGYEDVKEHVQLDAGVIVPTFAIGAFGEIFQVIQEIESRAGADRS